MILRINLWTDVAETVHDSLSKLEIPDCFVRERKYRQPKEKVGFSCTRIVYKFTIFLFYICVIIMIDGFLPQ